MLLLILLNVAERNLIIRRVDLAHFSFGKFLSALILKLIGMVFAYEFSVRCPDFFFGRSRRDAEDGIWVFTHHLLLQTIRTLDIGERLPRHHTAARHRQTERNDIIHKSAVALICQKSEIPVDRLLRLNQSHLGDLTAVLQR